MNHTIHSGESHQCWNERLQGVILLIVRKVDSQDSRQEDFFNKKQVFWKPVSILIIYTFTSL